MAKGPSIHIGGLLLLAEGSLGPLRGLQLNLVAFWHQKNFQHGSVKYEQTGEHKDTDPKIYTKKSPAGLQSLPEAQYLC